ncbi:PP241 [Orf virus]|uniref:PP241 n=1 Tax=Orf virus TaxID=10258 RepID=F1AXC6_ORFV|nr:PP241 [Orf virus]
MLHARAPRGARARGRTAPLPGADLRARRPGALPRRRAPRGRARARGRLRGRAQVPGVSGALRRGGRRRGGVLARGGAAAAGAPLRARLRRQRGRLRLPRAGHGPARRVRATGARALREPGGAAPSGGARPRADAAAARGGRRAPRVRVRGIPAPERGGAHK